MSMIVGFGRMLFLIRIVSCTYGYFVARTQTGGVIVRVGFRQILAGTGAL